MANDRSLPGVDFAAVAVLERWKDESHADRRGPFFPARFNVFLQFFRL